MRSTAHQENEPFAGVMSELTNTEELGKRGELLFAGQVVLALLVLVPPFDLGNLSRLVGVVAFVGGLAITSAGGKSLGKNMSPLSVPRQDKGTLIKEGMYKCAAPALHTANALHGTRVASHHIIHM